MPKSPDAFRTISEVADWLGVQAHVLRFWESKFAQVKPTKRAGGRRYYRPSDMLLLGGIKKLLHDDGLTIKGAQKLLREKGVAHVADMSQPLDDLTMAVIESNASGAVEASAEIEVEAPLSRAGDAIPSEQPDTPGAMPEAVRVEPDASPADDPADEGGVQAVEDAAVAIASDFAPPATEASPEETVEAQAELDLAEELGAIDDASGSTAPPDAVPAETVSAEAADILPPLPEAEVEEPEPRVEAAPAAQAQDAAPEPEDVSLPPVAAEAEATSAPPETETPPPLEPAPSVPTETPHAAETPEPAGDASDLAQPVDASAEEAGEASPSGTAVETDAPPVMPSFRARARPPAPAGPAAEAVDVPAPVDAAPEPAPPPPPALEEMADAEAPSVAAAPARQPLGAAIPPLPALAEIEAGPALVSTLARIRRLTPDQARELKPHLARLERLRDGMAARPEERG